MTARIYKPARNAMQSGQAGSRRWVLEYSASRQRELDPLMGWTGSDDTQSQVKLFFDSRESARKYAQEHAIEYVLSSPNGRKTVVRAGGYGDNFSTYRRAVWTH